MPWGGGMSDWGAGRLAAAGCRRGKGFIGLGGSMGLWGHGGAAGGPIAGLLRT